jgi:hypothetical protein
VFCSFHFREDGAEPARTDRNSNEFSPLASAVEEFSTELAIAVSAVCNRVLEK